MTNPTLNQKSNELDSVDIPINLNISNINNQINKISKPKIMDVDIHNMKIDRELFYKFKSNTTHE